MKRDESDGSLAKTCIIHSQYRMNSKTLKFGISLSYLATSNILEQLAKGLVRESGSILYIGRIHVDRRIYTAVRRLRQGSGTVTGSER